MVNNKSEKNPPRSKKSNKALPSVTNSPPVSETKKKSKTNEKTGPTPLKSRYNTRLRKKKRVTICTSNPSCRCSNKYTEKRKSQS